MANMVLEEKISVYEFYRNPETGRLVTIQECDSRSWKKMYFVWVRDGEENAITVATRCTYNQAMAIAREYYFKEVK